MRASQWWIALAVMLTVMNGATAHAYVLLATETHRMEYENGKAKHQGLGEFELRFEVDEDQRTVNCTEYRYIGRNKARLDEFARQSIAYTITSIDNGDSMSSTLMADEAKQGQRMITAVGNW